MTIDHILFNFKNSERSILALGAILGICLFLNFIYAAWQWENDWALAHQELNKESHISTKDATSEMITAIPEAHLFGHTITKTGNMPITNLQLRLTGIVKFNQENQANSKVYLSISGQPSKVYQIGDRLPDGVKIYEISTNTLILENEGRLEKLPLSRAKLTFKSRSNEGYLQ